VGDALDISVVIPTFERWPVLERTLGGIAEQDLDGCRAEVIVVDNGSRDGSRDRLTRAAREWTAPISLKLVHEPIRGPSAARNAGVLAASGRLVLFLGDDCVPAGPGLIA
jgi:glycosyltransferase involved in cell wall biosynthesis